MRIGLSLPARTFMPEETKQLDNSYNAFNNLLYGYNFAMHTGYDYVEAAVGAVNELTDSELQELAELSKSGKFSLEICNCFIPGNIPIFHVPFETLETFVDNSMRRMSVLKVEKVVFGSGVARMRPDSVTVAEGNDFLAKFLTMCSKTGIKYGISTLLEQLNSTETNLINTVSEGADAVRNLNLPNISLLADVFHMSVENEDVSVIAQNIDIISHFHVSEAPGRVFPGKYGGDYIKKFGTVLKKHGIDKDITVECVFDSFEEEAEKALGFLKEEVL